MADLLDEGLGFGVAEFGFGLAFELGVGEFHRDDGGEAFPDVVAGEVLVLVPQQFLVAGVPVDDGGECGAEALFVGAAFSRVDGVGEGVHRGGVGLVPLHRDLDGDPVAGFFERDDGGVDGLLGGVEVADEVRQPAS